MTFFQIVAGGLHHLDLLLVALAPGGGHRNFARSGQILPGHRPRIALNGGGRAVADDLAAMHPGTGTNIKDVIGLTDHILVMFHHDHRIALIAQVLERGNQPVIVALVQTD